MTTPRPMQYLWIVVGFGLWATALALIYGFHAVGCAYLWPDWVLKGGIAAITLAHLALLGWFILMWRGRDGFLATLTLWTLAGGAVAVAGSYLPLLFLTTCIP